MVEGSSIFEKLKIDSFGQIVKGKGFGQLNNEIVVNMWNFYLKWNIRVLMILLAC